LNVWDVMSCLGMSYDIDMHAFIVADEENGALFFSVNTHPSALMDPVNLSSNVPLFIVLIEQILTLSYHVLFSSVLQLIAMILWKV
jgi:hypothetical protein